MKTDMLTGMKTDRHDMLTGMKTDMLTGMKTGRHEDR